MNATEKGQRQRKAIVTGATGNLGTVVCDHFLKAGYKVYAIGASRKPDFPTVFSKNFIPLQADLASEDIVEKLFNDEFSELDRLDAGLFLAGGFAPGKINSIHKKDFEAMYRLNFETAFYLSRLLFEKMKTAGGGKLCFMGSRPAIESGSASGMVPYALSKSLVVKLAEIYGEAGKKFNIGAIAICPSTIDTPENRSSMPDADFSSWVSPHAVAESLLYFCSDDAGAIRTGAIRMFGGS